MGGGSGQDHNPHPPPPYLLSTVADRHQHRRQMVAQSE